MRFLLAVLVWIVFVGGLWAYTTQRDASLPLKHSIPQAPQVLAKNLVLEITPSFTIEKDPFALDLDDDASVSTGLEVRLNGRDLGVQAGQIQRGKVIRITKNMALTQGLNEFYVKASPPMTESGLEHGLRVRLLDRDAAVVDQTIWSSSGAIVAGTVSFSVAVPKEDIHDR